MKQNVLMFALDIQKERQMVPLPKGAKILSCQTSYWVLALWAQCEMGQTAKEERLFEVVRTSAQLSDGVVKRSYIGTCVSTSGVDYALHIFEVQLR